MFDQVVNNLRKATETTVELQQDLFKKWVNLLSGAPAAAPGWGLEQAQRFQKNWTEAAQEALKRQREAAETQFQAGLRLLEKAFQAGDGKGNVFEQGAAGLRRAAEATVGMQQEVLQKLVALWSSVPAAMPTWTLEQLQRFQKNWTETAQESLKRQREIAEGQFKNGLQLIEKGFQFGEVKTFEDAQKRTVELWQECCNQLRQAGEQQAREFQAAMDRWVALVSKPGS